MQRSYFDIFAVVVLVCFVVVLGLFVVVVVVVLRGFSVCLLVA